MHRVAEALAHRFLSCCVLTDEKEPSYSNLGADRICRVTCSLGSRAATLGACFFLSSPRKHRYVLVENGTDG